MIRLIFWSAIIILMIGGVYKYIGFSTDGENIIIKININGVKQSAQDGITTTKELTSNISVNSTTTTQQ